MEAEAARLREALHKSYDGKINYAILRGDLAKITDAGIMSLTWDEHVARGIEIRKERDDLRAKLAALEKQYQACEDTVATEFERCGRLLEALRGINEHEYDRCDHTDNFDCRRYLKQLAREAIAKEEWGAK